MRMRPLFREGPQVSVVGLSLSSPPTASQPLNQLALIAPQSEDPAESGEGAQAATIARALELGINLFDTDWITAGGHAQEVLGRALQGADRDAVQIACKAGPRMAFHGELLIDNSRANLINQCHDSLFRLKTERIDLYQVHWPDDTSPIQTARGLQDLISGNYAKWVGVCNYGLPDRPHQAPDRAGASEPAQPQVRRTRGVVRTQRHRFHRKRPNPQRPAHGQVQR